ncbi:MAG: hypothetical protein Q8L23_00870 [Caulobacter sp.]|nr:hypothetical protein [Caulobacter sp.]
MSRRVAAAMAGLMLLAQPAGAAPRGPSTTPEGNPVDPSMPTATAPAARGAAPPAPSSPPKETTVEGLTITARPVAPPIDTVSAFVSDVSAEGPNGRLARWDRKVCPGVIGVKQPYAQRLIDRIALVAVTVGLQVGEPGCKANMVIVATDDSQAMAKMVVDRNPTAFGRWETGVSRGRAALKDFVETPRAVRWWHITRTILADGEAYDRGSLVTVRSLGRIRATSRDTFDHVVIMVDVTRVGVIRFEALADYVTMVGLAQIDPDADPAGVSSILNLFAARDRGGVQPTGLTGWDVAYLQSLYSVNPNVIRGSRQERDIVRAMSDRLGVAPADREPAGEE